MKEGHTLCRENRRVCPWAFQILKVEQKRGKKTANENRRVEKKENQMTGIENPVKEFPMQINEAL